MMHFAMSFRYAQSDLVPDSINLAQLLTSRLNRVTDRILPDPVRPPPLLVPLTTVAGPDGAPDAGPTDP